jgi:flagellar protein FlbD
VTIEQTPDTLISLTTSERVIVRETPNELVTRIMQWRRDVARPLVPAAEGAAQ